MSASNKDGPAFPIVGTHEDVIEIGMTLRDYFAAKAMQGFLSAPDCGWDMSEVAVAAYQMADVMLVARNKA